MLSLIPRQWTRGAQRNPGLIVTTRTPLECDPSTIELLLRGRRKENSLGTYTLSGNGTSSGTDVPENGMAELRAVLQRHQSAARDVKLRLPANVFLHREVVLPLLAERAPERVLEYEMDRLTPFKSDELAWTWTVERRDPKRGELHLRLSFVPKAKLSRLLGMLEQAGAAPAMLEMAMTGERTRWIVLRPLASERVRGGQFGVALASGLCVVLAIVAILLPFELQSSQRRMVEARFVDLKPRVARVEAVRREIATRAAGHDVFSAEQVRVGNALEILGALTDILPDETFLTGLTLSQRKLTLEGQSAAAARLITLLSANRVIHDPTFAAPVTRVENGKADQFSIRAEVAP